MSATVETLIARLDLEPLDRDLFRGHSPEDGRKRVFGGQVAAQALTAAMRTLADPIPTHSLHAYFLRPGDPSRPIVYEVDRIRDGHSFVTRRIVAIQEGIAILNMSASFHRQEPGLSHQTPMPEVPPPGAAPSVDSLIASNKDARNAPIFAAIEKLQLPIMLHDLSAGDLLHGGPVSGPHRVWLKTRGDMSDSDLHLHQCILTFASDLMLADASLRVHGRSWFEPELMVASLDHAMWFHRPFRADQWLLYSMESPSSSGARGLNLGSFFQDGQLIATVAQESLMRERRPRRDRAT